MTSKTIANGILRAVGITVLATVFLFLCYQIRTVFIYLIVGLILTLIGNPIQNFFNKKLKFNNALATIATIFLFLLIIIGFVMMFVPLILSESQNLSLLNTNEIAQNTKLLFAEISGFLENHNINSAALLKQLDWSSKMDFNFVPTLLNSILGTLGSFGIGLASVLFITFFFLKDKILFTQGIKYILPDKHEEKILNSIYKINQLLSRYFIGLLIQMLIVFVLYLIVLLIFGIENAFIIAFLCSVLNIIPYIGAFVGAILAAVLTLTGGLKEGFHSEFISLSLYVFIGFIIVHLIDNNISQPIIFSKSVKSHPLEIFLVILIAGFLSGITGMIIAIPLYTMLKVIAKEFFPNNKIIEQLTKNI